MAQSIPLSVGTPAFVNNLHAAPSVLPGFGQHRRCASQKQRPRKNVIATNTLPQRQRDAMSNSSMRQQADVIRYISKEQDTTVTISHYSQIELQQKLYFNSFFSPGIHSTPLYRNKNNSHKMLKGTSSCSLGRRKTAQLPPTSLSHSNIYFNDYELFKSSSRINAVPTVSKKVENDNQATYNIAATPGTESKIIKRRGIRGVSWILNLALKDTTVGKIYRTQIGWIIFILVIFILIGGLLIHYSGHFTSYHMISFTNFTDVPPKLIFNKTLDSSTVQTTPIELMYSEDANSTFILENILINNNDISSVNMSTTTLVTADTTNRTLLSENQNYETEIIALGGNDNLNKSSLSKEHRDYCRGCRKGLDVCIAGAEDGIPVCRTVLDTRDPTGCGGLCALEVEACHLLDHKHSIYMCQRLQPLEELCQPDEWKCKNSLCIPKTKRCDGHMNCYDRSDETDCVCDLTKNFHCGNSTSCLNNSKKCDKTLDCWDGSDELHCINACPEDKFTCSDGECINRSLFCDALADCKDKSDEPIGCDGKCWKNDFKCTNKRCISKWKVCNGVDNCGDQSDELSCPNVTAS